MMTEMAVAMPLMLAGTPFMIIGQKLCDQPPGARVGHGEL